MDMRVLAAALALAIAAAIAGPARVPAGERLIVAGSGTNIPATAALARAYAARHPGIDIQIPASIGSTGGVRAVADGAIAVGLASRPLKDSEQALGLTAIPYARTAIVLGVHPTVVDDVISSTDLVDIYAGRKTRWSDGRQILVLTREPSDSSIEILQALVPGFKQVYGDGQQAKRWPTLFTDLSMNETLVRTPYALGLTDMGAMTADRLAIKPLRLNGVSPTAAEVQSGRYPLVKTLWFVVAPNRTSADAQRFIDFALSKEGMAMLAAAGYAGPTR